MKFKNPAPLIDSFFWNIKKQAKNGHWYFAKPHPGYGWSEIRTRLTRAFQVLIGEATAVRFKEDEEKAQGKFHAKVMEPTNPPPKGKWFHCPKCGWVSEWSPEGFGMANECPNCVAKQCLNIVSGTKEEWEERKGI